MWVIHLQLSLITKNCSPILPCIASISCWLCLLYFTQSIPYEAVRGRRGGGGGGEGEGKRNKQSDPWTMNIGLVRGMHSPEIGTIDNGNRTKWSLIRSVIICEWLTKLDDCKAGVWFVYHYYDYRQNWTTRNPVTN